ncbi:MAG: hypothetical protein IKI66_09585 [Bacteroidales bacterium]|nr:hypothetical protein [Bacteroidales bacterium]
MNGCIYLAAATGALATACYYHVLYRSLTLREELRTAGYYNVTYFRDKHGNHFQEGGRALIDILLLALNN